jgi:hypothetical protein
MKRASSLQDQELLKVLKEMESLQSQYPEELLTARRASFLDQVVQATPAQAQEQPASQDQKVIDQLKRLGSVPVKYPPRLLAVRRLAYVSRIAWLNFVSLWAAMWLAVQKWIPVQAYTARIPALRALPASLLAASLVVAVFAGYLFYENNDHSSQSPRAQTGTVHSGRNVTADTREVKIICKSGALPPLCLAGEFKKDNALTYQGNGTARPAVAKDTMPGPGELHKASYINDGLYGPGASWISNSRNSWIKIDLGKATKINTVTFGRDRLGKLSGHNPGKFVVSLALADNVYANGNSNNDNKEYQPVYSSDQAGFSGTISGADTVTAQFDPQVARYIKISFENKGTAIDEVEAFMAQPPVAASAPDHKDKPSVDSPAPLATNTSYPSDTATSQPVDTDTPVPTDTSVPSDTATPLPSATPIPTSTPVPTSTSIPTNTVVPSDTALPEPTDTPVPPDTDTPVPTEPPIETSTP